MTLRLAFLASVCAALCMGDRLLAADAPSLVLQSDPASRYCFGGIVGRRIEANVEQWLLRAPAANPGMLAMFRLRDRQPPPNLVPWAGEFVGKYLISAIAALRMTENAELEKTVRAVVAELLASQDQDGYLGPFPKDARLLGNWDLWGHYHCMLALMMWHERTGDEASLRACIRAADLACKTYLQGSRRVYDAGSHEMNMAIVHSLGQLHRQTREARYLRLMREIEKDWQRAGDYLRTGVSGVEFFRTPRPRWESLHDLQGLVEFYRITGDPRYRCAFLHHWQSIRRWDRRNSGAFSSGEQADGNPYKPSAIETCCTIAWMAITIDALRLTGDVRAADELELSTLNLVLGAQNPSGSWWTYNTPMDGSREASAHTIVFQARAGTPELNCCSVNGPRGLGMLCEWAVMQSDAALVVNYLGPMRAQTKTPDGTAVTVVTETDYPRGNRVQIRLMPAQAAEFSVKVRIPGWSGHTKVGLCGSEPVAATAGGYCEARRLWKPGDTITVDLDVSLRYVSGDREMYGRMSVYRGPLLLAYDVAYNDFEEGAIPPISPAMLSQARLEEPSADGDGQRSGQFVPLVTMALPVGDGRTLRLCDFATAGSRGSRYVSWLPAQQIVPPVPVGDAPSDRARVAPGPIVFTWRRPAAPATSTQSFTVVVASDEAFCEPVLEASAQSGHRAVIAQSLAGRLKPGVDYFWKLVARNSWGVTESLAPAKRFQIDPQLPPLRADQLSEFGEGPDGVVTAAALKGDPQPSHGKLVGSQGWQPAPGPSGEAKGAIALDGESGMVVYAIPAFPGYQYSVSLWLAHDQRSDRLGQVVSAWQQGMDDPLRICVDKGRLFARIEAGAAFATEGVAVERGRWYHVAVVKDGSRLTLYVDAKPAARAEVPEDVSSVARDFALGGNPHYTAQSEHLACRLSEFRFFARALSDQEVAKLCGKDSGK